MSNPFSTDEKNIKHWVLPEVSGRVIGGKKEEDNIRPQTVEDIKAVYEEGRKKGYQDGFAEAKAEIKKITNMLQFMQHPLRELDTQVEHELAELAIILARSLLKKECCDDVSHIQNLVHESLEYLPSESRNIKVHLNPLDIQLMKKADIDPFAQEWKCIEDNKVTQGGCKIDSAQSHIDASVETRVQQLVDQLEEHLPQNGGVE